MVKEKNILASFVMDAIPRFKEFDSSVPLVSILICVPIVSQRTPIQRITSCWSLNHHENSVAARDILDLVQDVINEALLVVHLDHGEALVDRGGVQECFAVDHLLVDLLILVVQRRENDAARKRSAKNHMPKDLVLKTRLTRNPLEKLLEI